MENSVKPHTGGVGGSPNSELENAGPKNKTPVYRGHASLPMNLCCALTKSRAEVEILNDGPQVPTLFIHPFRPRFSNLLSCSSSFSRCSMIVGSSALP